MAVPFVMTHLPLQSARQASLLTLSLYRTIQRNVPNLISLYDQSCTPEELRRRIRAGFRKNGFVTDPRVSEVLLLRSAQQYDEFMSRYATADNFSEFTNPLVRKWGYASSGDASKDALHKFILGIDDEEEEAAECASAAASR